MSCWLLAMVTHARLQSKLQVRDPLARSVSFVSFISCPLLLKPMGKKKKEEKVFVRVPKQTSSLFSLSRKVAPGFIPEGTWDPICTGEMTPLQPTAATAAQVAQGGGWSPGEEGSAQTACKR